MKWTKCYSCGNLSPSAGRVSRAKMMERKAWARELVAKVKRNDAKKEGGKHETK